MKVSYDITILGLGHASQIARTGVFRVVENVAEQLILKDLQLQFISDLEPLAIINAIEYLKCKNSFSSVDFFLTSDLQKRISLFQKKQKLLEENNSENSSINKLTSKIAFNTIRAFSKLHYLYKNDNAIYRTILDKSDIYHSPFLPIPKALRAIKGKALFLT